MYIDHSAQFPFSHGHLATKRL